MHPGGKVGEGKGIARACGLPKGPWACGKDEISSLRSNEKRRDIARDPLCAQDWWQGAPTKGPWRILGLPRTFFEVEADRSVRHPASAILDDIFVDEWGTRRTGILLACSFPCLATRE